MNGLIPLTEVSTNFTSSISFTNGDITLDQYVPIDAAYFSIHFSKPRSIKTNEPISKLDSTLKDSSSLLQELSDVLDDEIAVAGFAPSGLAGVGENLVIRKIKDTRAIFDWLKKLEEMGLIYQTDRTYYFRSESVSKTISSGLSSYDTFYISITSESLVMSPRLGLTKRVRSDRSRRRVISYNKTYIESKNTTAKIEHEATTSKIGEDQVFYCNQRGIPTEKAIALIVNGFSKDVLNKLPMEFAVEAQKLLEISLEGSVG